MIPKTTETTSISIPSWLIELVDDYCAKTDMSRSAFIVRALRKYFLLKFDDPTLWNHIYNQKSKTSCEDL
jgi:hypothetical protein